MLKLSFYSTFFFSCILQDTTSASSEGNYVQILCCTTLGSGEVHPSPWFTLHVENSNPTPPPLNNEKTISEKSSRCCSTLMASFSVVTASPVAVPLLRRGHVEDVVAASPVLLLQFCCISSASSCLCSHIICGPLFSQLKVRVVCYFYHRV